MLRLERQVAVKVLPQHLAADASLLSRFEREARSVAALSHPNILSIHDIGNQEGVFQYLGTPEKDKRQVFYETGHNLPRSEMIREVLNWFDRYLGPVR